MAENILQNPANPYFFTDWGKQRYAPNVPLPNQPPPADFRGPMPLPREAMMPAFAAQDVAQGPMTSEQMMQQSGANTIPGPQFTKPPPVDPRLLSYLRMQQPLPPRPSPDFQHAPSEPSLSPMPQQAQGGIPPITQEQEFGTPRIPDSMNERIDPNIGGAIMGIGERLQENLPKHGEALRRSGEKLGALFTPGRNRVQEWMQANPQLALGMLHGGAMGGAVGGLTAGPVGAAAGAALGATGLPAGIQLSDRMKEYLNRQ
jgi:hypothetical protein